MCKTCETNGFYCGIHGFITNDNPAMGTKTSDGEA